MIRAYKFLLRPTARQAVALGEMLRDHRPLYNGALQERRGAYRHVSKTSVRYGGQSAQLKEIRRLDKAFQAFFKRVKAGQTPGYPRFKGCRWDSAPDNRHTRVRLQGVGHVRVHQHRPVRGRVKTISVKREGKRWYVVLACDNVPTDELPPTGAIIGIDMGTTHFLTTSEGRHGTRAPPRKRRRVPPERRRRQGRAEQEHPRRGLGTVPRDPGEHG